MKRAFSLLELIVIMAIVMILSAIIIPIYKGAKNAAHRTDRLMRVKQIALSLDLYREDYEGRTMYSSSMPGFDWPSLVKPYIKSNELLRNPSYREKLDVPVVLGYGFALNTCVLGVAQVETPNPIQVFEAVPLQSGTAMVSMLFNVKFDKDYAVDNPGFLPIGNKYLANHDVGGSILTFWNGNAKWIQYESLKMRVTGSCSTSDNEDPLFETTYSKK